MKQYLRKINVLFFHVFTGCIFSSAVAAQNESAAQVPLTVYTGVLHSEKTGYDILTRMTFIDTSVAKKHSYAATVTLFIGNEFSNEYATAFYDSAFMFENSREILLQRNDPVISRRLPIIRVKFSEDGNVASGRFVAGQFGEVGSLEFALGWFPPSGKSYHIIEPIGGVYDARCPFGTVELRSLHIVASRIYSEVTSNDGLPGAVQYIANGYCSGPAYAGNGNCAHARSGLFNFYDNTLVFNRGAVACRRSNGKNLSCNLLGTVEALKSNDCTFQKRESAQHQDLPIEGAMRPRVRPIVWHRPPVESSEGPSVNCEKLNLTKLGVLTHLRDGRKQLLNLRLDAFANLDDDGNKSCLITGSLALEFPTKETLNFTLPATKIDTDTRNITLMSEESTDAAITIDALSFSEEASGVFTGGYWFSRLFGIVGVIDFLDKGISREDFWLSDENFVFGGNGHYDCGPKIMSLVLFASPWSNSRTVYWDPFNQQKYGGALAGFNAANPSDFPLPSYTIPILESSFDYFSNSLVFESSSLYTGYADKKGLHLWGGPSRRYIKNVSLDEQFCVRQESLVHQ